jgi:NAD(P)-dependent dehydrogenase (short-subunit alcohol dehydrogenase family)
MPTAPTCAASGTAVWDQCGFKMSGLVLVTGATGGIGQLVAIEVAKSGNVPVIGYRKPRYEDAQALKRSCGGVLVELDMTISSTIDNALTAIVADGRPVLGVVLAASPAPVLAPFGKISPSDHAMFWSANVVGPHRLLSGLVRLFFRPQKSGSVVAVLSKAMDVSESGGTQPKAMSGMGAYTISKYGLQGVMAQLAGEFGWLATSCVYPGFTETKMLNAFDSRFVDQLRASNQIVSPEAVVAEIVKNLSIPT